MMWGLPGQTDADEWLLNGISPPFFKHFSTLSDFNDIHRGGHLWKTLSSFGMWDPFDYHFSQKWNLIPVYCKIRNMMSLSQNFLTSCPFTILVLPDGTPFDRRNCPMLRSFVTAVINPVGDFKFRYLHQLLQLNVILFRLRFYLECKEFSFPPFAPSHLIDRRELVETTLFRCQFFFFSFLIVCRLTSQSTIIAFSLEERTIFGNYHSRKHSSTTNQIISNQRIYISFSLLFSWPCRISISLTISRSLLSIWEHTTD